MPEFIASDSNCETDSNCQKTNENNVKFNDISDKCENNQNSIQISNSNSVKIRDNLTVKGVGRDDRSSSVIGVPAVQHMFQNQ